ncbi:MAG TPA: DUF6111 family protein [Hyphomicrobiaceae bacterium]|nr:DUF6111 family protein [Hyphomicrobiaceae bacterium]
MIRIVIENLLLFLAPTAIYVVYIYLSRRGKVTPQNVLDEAPLIWLCAAGAAVVVITLLTFGTTSGGKPGQTYEPPELRDGKIVPGKLK